MRRSSFAATEYIDPVATHFAEGDEADSGLAPRRLTAPPALAGVRLDKALAQLVPEFSRGRLQQWIEAGAVRVDGARAHVRQMLLGGETIEVVPLPAPEDLALRPEPMPLEVVYEDAHIAVLDKPPGLVVHPAAGHWSGTLANGVLARWPQAAALPRAGIVHRLDADTSGLMVVALTLRAQTELVRSLAQRTVVREYWAIVAGAAPKLLTIDAALARDPRNPLRFAVSRSPRARPARTHLRCVQTVGSGRAAVSWVVCRLDTGRTHQIRVHLESVGLPLVGDPLYRRGRPAPQPRAGAGRSQRTAGDSDGGAGGQAQLPPRDQAAVEQAIRDAADRAAAKARAGQAAPQRAASRRRAPAGGAGDDIAARSSAADLAEVWQRFARQALHACRLGLRHPDTQRPMSWFRPPPQDMRLLMRACGFVGGEAPVDLFD
jgi:RluA family pseudouridine synthase